MARNNLSIVICKQILQIHSSMVDIGALFTLSSVHVRGSNLDFMDGFLIDAQ